MAQHRVDWRWLAGFFDGEGYVGWNHRRGTNSMTITVMISNTYRPAIDVLVAWFGGRVQSVPKRKPHHKAQYRWWCYAGTTKRFLEGILPFALVKRRQIELALEAFALIGRRGKRVSSDNMSRRLVLAAAMKEECHREWL